MSTTTILAPDGTPRDVPDEQVTAALQAGGKRAVKMSDPQGQARWIPEDKVAAAQNAGGKIAAQATPQKGFLESAWDSGPVSGLVHGVTAVGGLLNDAVHGRPADDNNPLVRSIQASPTVQLLGDAMHGRPANDANPIVQGVQGLVHHGPTLDVRRKLANSIPMVGDTLATAEQQSDAGNNSGAMGTMTGLGLTALAPKVIPKILEAAPELAGRAALLGKTPQAAYESALKPSTALPQFMRTNVVQTALDHGIPISKGGLESLGDLIDDYNQKIKDVINTDPTRPIDPNKVAIRADDARAKFAKQVNASGDVAAIDASRQQFLTEQGAMPGRPAGPMDAAAAQDMKQGTYETLKGKYGEQGRASEEAQKALARGLKEEIAQQFPEIRSLNATESRLLDLQPILERAVNRISNHQSIGIGTPIAGAAAKAVTGSGSIGVVAGTLKAVLDNPFLKSRLAIAVSKGAKIPFSQAMTRVQAYSSALGLPAGASEESSDGQTALPQP